ncbi:MAG: hypothetical protein ABEJ66_03445, partial [Candidatus Nanohaloarchaea archaeon]
IILDLMRKLACTRVFPAIDTLFQPILLEDLMEATARLVNRDRTGLYRLAGPEKMTLGNRL